MNIDTEDILIAAVVLLCLICVVLARSVCRLSRDLHEDRKRQKAVEAEIERAGWMGLYRDAHNAAHLAEWDRRNAPRIKAEAEAIAKIEDDARAARVRAYAAKAKATPEAQAIREARAAKALKALE